MPSLSHPFSPPWPRISARSDTPPHQSLALCACQRKHTSAPHCSKNINTRDAAQGPCSCGWTCPSSQWGMAWGRPLQAELKTPPPWPTREPTWAGSSVHGATQHVGFRAIAHRRFVCGTRSARPLRCTALHHMLTLTCPFHNHTPHVIPTPHTPHFTGVCATVSCLWGPRAPPARHEAVCNPRPLLPTCTQPLGGPPESVDPTPLRPPTGRQRSLGRPPGLPPHPAFPQRFASGPWLRVGKKKGDDGSRGLWGVDEGVGRCVLHGVCHASTYDGCRTVAGSTAARVHGHQRPPATQ